MLKKIAVWLAILLLAAAGVGGLYNAFSEIPGAESTLQLTVGISQIVYGFGGIAAVIALVMRKRWGVAATIVTCVGMTWAATIASFAFHDPQFKQSGTVAGTASAFGSMLLASWFLIWAARVATRSPVETTSR